MACWDQEERCFEGEAKLAAPLAGTGCRTEDRRTMIKRSSDEEESEGILTLEGSFISIQAPSINQRRLTNLRCMNVAHTNIQTSVRAVEHGELVGPVTRDHMSTENLGARGCKRIACFLRFTVLLLSSYHFGVPCLPPFSRLQFILQSHFKRQIWYNLFNIIDFSHLKS